MYPGTRKAIVADDVAARTGRSARRAGRPSASEADALEQEILSAALLEFRSHGFSGASIERIANAANVTRSAIYRRYMDKRTLFETVLQAEIGKLKAMAASVIQASDDPLLRLRATAKAYCRYILSPVALDLQRIVIWETARTPSGNTPAVHPVPADLAGQLDEVIAFAQAAGRLKAAPPSLWRDALLRLVAEGPRWEALASGVLWSEDRLTVDFDRMWTVFIALAGTDSRAP